MKETKEISTYKKDMEYTSIQCLKGVTEFELSPKKVIHILKNINNMKLWDPLIKDTTVVEVVDNHTEVVHLKFGAKVCLLSQKRDFVILRHWQERKDGSFILVHFTTLIPLGWKEHRAQFSSSTAGLCER